MPNSEEPHYMIPVTTLFDCQATCGRRVIRPKVSTLFTVP
jgi:hypothetical protein